MKSKIVRSVKRRRSDNQKKQTTSATLRSQSLRDENIPPLPPIQSVPSPSRTPATYIKSIKSLQSSLSYHKTTLRTSRTTVQTLNKENRQLQTSLKASLSDNASAFQQISHAQACLSAVQLDLSETRKKASDSIFSSNAYLDWTTQEHARISAVRENELAHLAIQNKRLSNKLSTRKKQDRQSHDSFRHLLNRKQRLPCKSQLRMKSKGTYTPESRALMRTLVASGCSQKHVGTVIKSVGSLLGIEIVDSVSKRSVRRSLIEGGVASTIQVGLAIATSKCEYFFISDKLILISC